MQINPIDILVLHTNANRLQEKEDIYVTHTLRNRERILKSIDKLVQANLLKLENSLEISLPRLKKTELESILTKAKIKKTGTKPVLVERIIENIDYINRQNIEIDLPTVYMPTAEGLELIKETKYIVHFSRGSSVLSIERAYNIIKECESKNVKDKIEYIFLYEIERIYKVNPFPDGYNDLKNNLNFYFRDFASYYKDIEDYSKSRKYYNLAQFLEIYYKLKSLDNDNGCIYNYNGEFNLHFIDTMPFGMEEVYEKFLYIDELTNDELFNLYIEDVSEYYEPEEEFSRIFINHSIAKSKRNNEEINEAISDLKKYCSINYPFEEPKYKKSYSNNSFDTFLTTSLKKLLENDIDVKVEIVKETGEVYIGIDQSESKRIFETELFDKLNNFNP